MRDYLRTSDLARAAGVHPNTVRRYVEWGLLPPVERTPAGYRRFTQRHLDCLRLARLVYIASYPGRGLRQSSVEVVRRVVADDLPGALEQARDHLRLVQAERDQAEQAAVVLERWAAGRADEPVEPALQTSQVIRLLGVTFDMLRGWERNGLISVPRDSHNRYRRFTPREISRLRVIRMLGQAGYSHMAMLRMFLQLDRGETGNLRQALDTPRPDEDIFSAADRWLSTLSEQEELSHQALALVEEIIERAAGSDKD